MWSKNQSSKIEVLSHVAEDSGLLACYIVCVCVCVGKVTGNFKGTSDTKWHSVSCVTHIQQTWILKEIKLPVGFSVLLGRYCSARHQ